MSRGAMIAMGPCHACGSIFAFNPDHVPSINNEPICQACMEQINSLRKAKGLEPFPVHRLAYEAAEV